MITTPQEIRKSQVNLLDKGEEVLENDARSIPPIKTYSSLQRIKDKIYLIAEEIAAIDKKMTLKGERFKEKSLMRLNKYNDKLLRLEAGLEQCYGIKFEKKLIK